VIAVGGDHSPTTSPLNLRTPIPDAEKVKRRAGCALRQWSKKMKRSKLPASGAPASVMARRILSDIRQPRAEDVPSDLG
jgi:cell division protein FtsA